jgi:hypothetical protein
MSQGFRHVTAGTAENAEKIGGTIEDSIHLDSLEAAVDAYASWGYYSQGSGAGESWQHGRFDWLSRGREASYEALSGFLTAPANWVINTDEKRAFLGRVHELTGEDGR